MSNLAPDRYREVSVATIDRAPTADTVRDHLLGREVYRRTRFVVLRHGTRVALARVRKPGDAGDAADAPLFAQVTDVEVLALPDETAWVDAPEVDTGVSSQLARVARERAPGARCVVVQGRHSHVSFLLDPDPVTIRVVDVAPPYPAKLVDQARVVLDVADDLPPVELRPDVTDLAELAASHAATRYLLPCRGSGLGLGTDPAYLDERPPDGDWVLVGCTRSREIHRWFYGREPPTVDMCPRRLAGHGAGGPTLTKCCLLEEDVYEREGDLVVVPWGATLTLVRSALGGLVGAQAEERAWSPG